ncbi:MAG: hypothetical protein ACRDUV_08125 [Pseudonocardiaceae bacterium]
MTAPNGTGNGTGPHADLAGARSWGWAVRRMSFVACVVKSAAALVGLTVVFVLVGITIPDDPGWGTIMIPLLFALVILWNVLTTRWFLAAQSGRSPLPWFRTSLRSLPVWAQVLLAVLVAPLVMAELRGEHLLRVQPRQARVLLTVVES